MTLLTNSFEGITPSGTTVSTGNSGGTSGNAFDTVNIGASATLASDSTHAAHGTLAATVSTGASSVSSYCGWNTTMGTQAQAWFRGYYYFTANPAANFSIWRAFSSGTLAAGILLLTTGQLRFVNTSSATILTTTATVPLNAWWRIEGFVIGSATVGQVELKLFTSPDAAAPAETDTSAASQNTFGSLTEWRWGVTGNTANVAQFWEDDLGLSNTGYIGPAVFAGVPAVAAWPGQTWRRRFHHPQNLGPPNQYLVSVLPAATVSTSGTVTDQVEPVYPVAVTTTGTIADRVGKTLPVTATTSGALSRAASRTLTVAVSAAGTLARSAGKTLTATASTAGTLARSAARTLPASVTTTGTLGRGVSRALAASVSTAGTLGRGLARVLQAVVSTVASWVGSQPPHHDPGFVTITPAGPAAAAVAVAEGAAGVAVTIPGSPGAVPGLAVPGLFSPGAPPAAAVVLTAAGPGGATAIAPAGPGGASVTITAA